MGPAFGSRPPNLEATSAAEPALNQGGWLRSGAAGVGAPCTPPAVCSFEGLSFFPQMLEEPGPACSETAQAYSCQCSPLNNQPPSPASGTLFCPSLKTETRS